MTIGTIVLIPFPFAEITNVKIRPALVVTTTKDKYHDLILCAISSVVPQTVGAFEMVLNPDNSNKLRVQSVLKVDRIVTLKKEDIIATLGRLTSNEIESFKNKFASLVD